MKKTRKRLGKAIPKGKRLQDFHTIPEPQHILLEIIVRSKVVREHAIPTRGLNLFLAAVQRQGAEIADLLAIDLQEDSLALHVWVLANAVEGAEPGGGIKVARQLEGVWKDFRFRHPVQGVHVRLGVLVEVLVPVQIPTTLVLADEVWVDVKGPFPTHAIALILYPDSAVVPHGPDDSRQQLVAGGDVLKEDPVLHPGTLVQQGVQAESIEHPGTDTVPVQVAFVLNAIRVVPPVADDVDAENVGNGGHMVREGAGGEFLAILVDRTPRP